MKSTLASFGSVPRRFPALSGSPKKADLHKMGGAVKLGLNAVIRLIVAVAAAVRGWVGWLRLTGNIRSGHFPWLVGRTSAIDQAFATDLQQGAVE